MSTEPTDRIVARKEGAVGWLVLNNPERRNAISLEMWQAIPRVLSAVEAEDETRVVVLTGAGDKAFASGADISQFEKDRATAERVQRYERLGDAAMSRLRELDKPTVAMIRGYLRRHRGQCAADDAHRQAGDPRGDAQRLRCGGVPRLGQGMLRQRGLRRRAQGLHGEAQAGFQGTIKEEDR